jgi:hypothetical protein
MACDCGSCVSCENIYAIPVGLNGAEGKGYDASSVTSINLATLGATLSLVISINKAYTVGARVRVSSSANPTTQYFEGIVNSYTPATGAIDLIGIDLIVGASTLASWNVNVAGEFNLSIQAQIDAIKAKLNLNKFENIEQGALDSVAAIPGSPGAAVLTMNFDASNNHTNLVVIASGLIRNENAGAQAAAFELFQGVTLLETASVSLFDVTVSGGERQWVHRTAEVVNYTAGEDIILRLSGNTDLKAEGWQLTVFSNNVGF